MKKNTLATGMEALLRHGLYTVVLPLALLTAAYVSLYQISLRDLLEKTYTRQSNALSEARTVVYNSLQIPENDVRFMVANPVVQRFLASGSSTDREFMARFLKDLMGTRRHLYDQLRYLDEEGMEVVRINNGPSGAVIVPDSALQNKRSRYYFTRGMSLSPGQIYISPFDLNVEHGQVEVPYKPTLRLAIRAMDGQGRPRGVLVINYLGQRLLDRLGQVSRNAELAFRLANQQGQWLLAPNAADDWSFMFPERAHHSLSRDDNRLWQQLQAIQHDLSQRLESHDGLWSALAIVPQRDISQQTSVFVTEPGMQWYLLSQLSAARLDQQRSEIRSRYWPTYVLLALLLLVLGTLVAVLLQRRRDALQQITQREHEFRELLEAAPDAIVVSDSAGLIVMVNAQTERSFGLSRAALLGQPVEILLPESLRTAHQVWRDDYLTQSATRAMGDGRVLLVRHQDGREFPVTIGLSTYQVGDARRVIAVIRDVSDLHRNLSALQEAQQRLAIAAEAAEVGIWDFDVHHNVLIWDDWMYRIYGVGRSDFSGAYDAWSNSVHPDDLVATSVALQAAIAGETKFNTHFRIIRPDGAVRWIKANAIALYAKDGEIERLIGTNVDVTEEHEAQQHIQAALAEAATFNRALKVSNKELESFSYSVSHDLRAPLRSVSGFSKILLKSYADKLDETGRDLLERMVAASQRMGQLIDDMLVLSRISRAEVVRQEFDLSALVATAVAQLRESFPERAVTMVIAPDLRAEGDPKLVRIALDNLLGNAWKFTAKTASARVEFGCERLEGGVEYFVRDNGAGFDMAYADKLFGAFQRLHTATEYPGTGIGLATVAA